MPALNGHEGFVAGPMRVMPDVRQIWANAFTLSRAAFARQMEADPRRDINADCGYPKTETLTAEFFQELYDRNSIAGRVVELFPNESWQQQPEVYEDEDPDKITPFEDAWNGLAKNLRDDESYCEDKEGHPVWEALRLADVRAGIGHYGIILLGVNDGKKLSEPVDGWKEANSAPVGKAYAEGQALNAGEPLVTNADGVYNLAITDGRLSKGKLRELLYIESFSQAAAPVVQWETNQTSRRFGMPVMYLVTFSDPQGGAGTTRMVHWSRVIHVTDTHHHAGINRFLATPRIQPVLNDVLDLRKVYGGDAEAYWKNAKMRLFFPTKDDVDVSPILPAMRDMMEHMENGVQGWATLSNMDVKSVAPQVVDPTPHVDKRIESICIKKDVPVRIFMGSERGNLASSQDEEDWNGTLRGRQRVHNRPKLIYPVTNRLIAMRCLPQPATLYKVDIPDIATQSDLQKADVGAKRMQGLQAYVGGVEAMMTEVDALIAVGYTEAQAKAINEAKLQQLQGDDLGTVELAAERNMEQPVDEMEPVEEIAS